MGLLKAGPLGRLPTEGFPGRVAVATPEGRTAVVTPPITAVLGFLERFPCFSFFPFLFFMAGIS